MTVASSMDFAIRVERLGPAPAARPHIVVAVPVKDEEQRIGACLGSLIGQVEVDFADVAVILLLNNCTDATAERVRTCADALPFALELRHVELQAAYANAGWARRLAMEAAAEWVCPDGLILTTDADTLMEADWIAANRREIAAGADAVAGYVNADPFELMELPPAILERGSLEWEYQQLGRRDGGAGRPRSARSLAAPQPELRGVRRHHLQRLSPHRRAATQGGRRRPRPVRDGAPRGRQDPPQPGRPGGHVGPHRRARARRPVGRHPAPGRA